MRHTSEVTPVVGVRLNEADRAAVGDIIQAIRTPHLPNVSMSDAIRAAIREMHTRTVTRTTR